VLGAKERAANDGPPPWVRHEHDERYRFASRFVDGADVVDVACGDGTGIATYAEAGARSIHAFDVSEPPPNRRGNDGWRASTSRLRTAVHCPWRMIRPTFSSLWRPSSTFPRPSGYVEEIARILRPGGVVVCLTPNRAVCSPGTPPDGKPWNPYHVKEFDLDELRESLGRKFVDLEYFRAERDEPVCRSDARRARPCPPVQPRGEAPPGGEAGLLLRDSPARHAVNRSTSIDRRRSS